MLETITRRLRALRTQFAAMSFEETMVRGGISTEKLSALRMCYRMIKATRSMRPSRAFQPFPCNVCLPCICLWIVHGRTENSSFVVDGPQSCRHVTPIVRIQTKHTSTLIKYVTCLCRLQSYTPSDNIRTLAWSLMLHWQVISL